MDSIPVDSIPVDSIPVDSIPVDSRAVVLGNEDFLALLTSCLVCVVKGEASIVDHLIECGFIHSFGELLRWCTI